MRPESLKRRGQRRPAERSTASQKRLKDITLQRLEITEARPGLFNDWLRSKGKLGGQHKVPRLNNSRNIIEEILALNGGK